MMLMKLTSSLPHNFTKKYFSFIAYTMEQWWWTDDIQNVLSMFCAKYEFIPYYFGESWDFFIFSEDNFIPKEVQ